MKIVNNNLLELRMRLRVKRQQDFADLLQIDRSHYTQIENNKKQMSLDRALKIYAILKDLIPDLHMEDIFELVEK